MRNVAHGDWDSQRQDVHQVLESLGTFNVENPIPTFEVWNKCDLPTAEPRLGLREQSAQDPKPFITSAVTGEGLAELTAAIDQFVTRTRVSHDFLVPFALGAPLAWLHAHGDVVSVDATEEGNRVSVRLTAKDFARFEHQFKDSAVEKL